MAEPADTPLTAISTSVSATTIPCSRRTAALRRHLRRCTRMIHNQPQCAGHSIASRDVISHEERSIAEGNGMSISAFLAGLLLLAGVLSPRVEAQGRPPAPGCPTVAARSGVTAGALAAADNRFGFRLFSTLLSRAGDANTFISPLSAASALQMTYDGAHGSTGAAMANVLGLQGMKGAAVRQQASALLSTLAGSDPHVQLDIANALWARLGEHFRQDFMQRVRAAYGARVTALDFNASSAPATINAWVQCATHNTITSIVDHIPPDMVLYLMNAVYFHGAWTVPFNPQQTRSEPFTLGSGSQKTVS